MQRAHSSTTAALVVAALVASSATTAVLGASAAGAAATPSSSSSSSIRGLHLHLPHMHAPHLQIPKGGFLFSPFHHHGGAHSPGAPPSSIPVGGHPAPTIGMHMQDLHKPPQQPSSLHPGGHVSPLHSSSPATGGDAAAPAAAASGQQSEGSHPHHHYPHLQMKGFFQSLRSWTSFKQYVRGVRDLILIAKPLEAALLRTGTVHDRDLSRFIARAVAFVAYSLIITSVLGTIGLDTKPIIAGLGVSGFIVGFALKEIATNVLSGILLVFQRPFKTGWKIKVGSHQGTVLSIDSRYVRLMTDEDGMILVPAYQVYTQAITIIERKDKMGRVIPNGVTPGSGATSASPAGGAAAKR